MIPPRLTSSPVATFVFFVLLNCIICSLALNSEYILDAHVVVEQNPVIQQPKLIKTVWSRDFFDAFKASAAKGSDPASGATAENLGYYRPLVHLSLALNAQLTGMAPWGFRVVNVLIHAANAWLIYYLLWLIFQQRSLALIAGLLFSVLPTNEWAVNYISGRADLLQTFFSLACLIGFWRYGSAGTNPAWFLFIIMGFTAALLSREASLLLPLFAGCLSMVHPATINHRRIKLGLIALFLLALSYYLFRLNFYPIIRDPQLHHLSLKALADWLLLSLEYNMRFLFPWTMFSSVWQIPGVHHVLILIGLTLLGAGSYRVWAIKPTLTDARKALILGWLWLMIGSLSLFITRRMFMKIGPYLSEHFLYFSSLGFVLILATILIHLQSRWQKIFFSLLLIYFTGATVWSNAHWTTEQHLLGRVAQKESRPSIAFEQLLMKYNDDRDAVQSMIDRQQSPAKKSLWIKRLGNIYHAQGDYIQANKYLEQAVELNSENFEARVELAVCELETGKIDEGLKGLEDVVTHDPENIDGYRLLGEAHYRQGEYSKAIQYFEKAVYLSPFDVSILQYLAMSYLLDHQKDKYQQVMDTLFKKRYNMKRILVFFAEELYVHRFYDQVIYLVETNQPSLVQEDQAQAVLGWAYLSKGDVGKARQMFDYVLSHNATHPLAQEGREALTKLGL
ncbi:MAG: tetratricopeptide repeat protein [Candidatus Omnitrophota bacterium]|nr:tetratricopeptide repeat protein [Candidatus Omnitrophota bacterium]